MTLSQPRVVHEVRDAPVVVQNLKSIGVRHCDAERVKVVLCCARRAGGIAELRLKAEKCSVASARPLVHEVVLHSRKRAVRIRSEKIVADVGHERGARLVVRLAEPIVARRWRLGPGTRARLRTVAWIAGVAFAIHAVALVADWTRLAGEQRALRQHMESRFRAAFPDAVAVADPALQMRRKLAEARHAVNQPDDGDFPAMIEKVAAGLKELPVGALRTISYESGRMTLELAVSDEALVRRVAARLIQAGLSVATLPAAARTGRDTVTMTVRAS